MRHMIIDLETLSIHTRAVTIAIGVSIIDSEYQDFQVTSVLYPRIKPQLIRRRRVEWDTILWWLSQSQEAIDSISRSDDQRVPIERALESVSFMWSQHGCQRVWENGSTFDVSIMESLFEEYKEEVPWNFRQVRDQRTLVEISGTDRVDPDVPHSAYHDAEAQARTIREALKNV